jgi:magnesium transporter
MIVDCAVYKNGEREDVEGSLSDALERVRAAPDGFIWIGLHEPTTEEFDLVSREFSLHPLAIEDAVHAHQRPKLDKYQGSLFIILKTLRYVEDTPAVESGEIMLFIGEGFAVTVRHGRANPLHDVRKRLEGGHQLLLSGPLAVLYGVCDQVVDTYADVARELQTDLDQLEERVFSPARTSDAELIYRLKRDVLEFRRAVVPLVWPLRTLSEGNLLSAHPELRPFFRDVLDHLLQLTGESDSFNDLLGFVLSSHMTEVTVRQNEDVRRISAWAAIIAVPTLFSGIYGMNFNSMPELRWNFGYPLALALMLAISALLYRLFRRLRWL